MADLRLRMRTQSSCAEESPSCRGFINDSFFSSKSIAKSCKFQRNISMEYKSTNCLQISRKLAPVEGFIVDDFEEAQQVEMCQLVGQVQPDQAGQFHGGHPLDELFRVDEQVVHVQETVEPDDFLQLRKLVSFDVDFFWG